MSRKQKFARCLVILPVIILMSFSCPLLQSQNPYDYTTLTPKTPMPTEQCGGNVSGKWEGTASGGGETVTYVMKLVQTDCTVTGSSVTGGSLPATVNGYVDQGIFHYTESGPGENCYWTANLAINDLNYIMRGQVTNCSQKTIYLERR